MRMRYFLVLLLLGSCAFGPGAQSQQASADGARKVVQRIIPTYPEVAKRINLSGTVKVLAVVAPDGSVKKVEPLGGSPLLLQAAQEAVSKWKYAPASAESREPVEMRFNPQ
ncbi:MAG: energy transducer TonB [Candidatus Sulfotelmatobacter sp.]